MSESRDESSDRAASTLVVLTGGRSGSNYLQELMIGNGLADPNEYFHPEFGFGEAVRSGLSTEEHLERVRAEKSRGGIFAVKVMASHIKAMATHVRQRDFKPDSEVLTRLFPDGRFVWLRRRNLIRQAVSLWRAWKTGEFKRWVGKEVEAKELSDPDPREVDEHLDYLLWTERVWESFFSRTRIEPLVLVYEDLVADPLGQLRRVLEALDVAVPTDLSAEVRIARQADTRTDEIVERYLEARPENRKYESLTIA